MFHGSVAKQKLGSPIQKTLEIGVIGQFGGDKNDTIFNDKYLLVMIKYLRFVQIRFLICLIFI